MQPGVVALFEDAWPNTCYVLFALASFLIQLAQLVCIFSLSHTSIPGSSILIYFLVLFSSLQRRRCLRVSLLDPQD